MNQKLQRLILEVISKNKGICEWRIIKNKVELNYWGRDNIPQDSGIIIKHQLDLLESEDKILRKDDLPAIFYILLPDGHRIFEPWYKKSWYFILYDKTNIYALLALLISFAALAVSIFK